MTTTGPYLTTAQLAAARGVTKQAISKAVREERLEPAIVLRNGYYLFNPDELEGDE
ncbi:type IV toxin-antitoxin system AbiEi family antitoxin domain-containing protein [Labedella phragmitis]|uniref:type IV toxin-antitoxin system AbiEi family antitoxin domain-containing protein n=1 Tax=Labedella phragmitis TaxID=2498849 RepID=UPI00140A3810|nr:type IV toxin-antitoxin system AbiEi family antitoxin domain-containing protein [Labedella phragmitis]